MKSSTSNPWEQLFRAMGETFARQAKEAFIGTVTSVSSTGIGLSIDGDNTGTKKYTCSRSERFSSGDRVLVVRESGTYVVVCRIGAPGGPTAKTNAMTQAVGADASGALWTEPSTLEVATASRLGGVKPITKTNAMTQDVGVDGEGRLFTTPAESYNLPTASTSQLGGVKTSEAYSSTKHTMKVAINSSGLLYGEAYSLPTASTSQLGGIKTSEAYSATKHTVKVAVNSSGVLYAAAGESYELPTASTSVIGGIKTSEAYSSTKHTVKVAANSSGVLYAAAESYELPTASTSQLGGIKTSEAYSATKHTVKVAVNSSGVLYAASGESYELPTASTSVIGGIKTAESYSVTKHTLKTAVSSSGVLYAEAPATTNPTKLYAGTSTTSYLELDSNKVLKPSGTGFNLGNSTYPLQDVYMGKTGASSYYLKVSDASIIPNSTTTTTSYYNLGSSTYPFNRLYVKELYINGTKFTPS